MKFWENGTFFDTLKEKLGMGYHNLGSIFGHLGYKYVFGKKVITNANGK